MAVKLSIFTTVTRPGRRGDNARDAIACYKDLADEVVIIDGGQSVLFNPEGNIRNYYYKWPEEFNWSFIGQQFQRGYEKCTGDWVIHADIDFIFHEKDFAAIRKACEDHQNAPALSFWKYQFIQPDRYNLKSRLVIAVNKKKYGDRIKFNSGGDFCQPSLDGRYIRPDEVPEAKVPLYNYERLIKTKTQIKNDAERMDKAYFRHFGRNLYSNKDRTAYKGIVDMMLGRYDKPQKEIPLTDHPIYVQKTILNLKPDQWGYSGFGKLPVNNYMKGNQDA